MRGNEVTATLLYTVAPAGNKMVGGGGNGSNCVNPGHLFQLTIERHMRYR